MYINLYKIDNEKLNKEKEETIEKDIAKDNEHMKQIDELKNKIKILIQEKTNKIENNEITHEKSNRQEYQCPDCNFKSIWMTTLKEHFLLKKCKKTKKTKK